MSDMVHAERREPHQPEGPIDLMVVADELLDQARDMAAGRAARTLTPGAGAPLKQTLLALVSGEQLAEHTAPGPATLQVLVGAVELGTGDHRVQVGEGQWAVIPDEQHDLVADDDAVVLLTVAAT